jgi:hypothetical protein
MEKAWYSNTFKDRITNQIKKAAESGDRMLTQLSENQRRERLNGEPVVLRDARDVFRKQLPTLTKQLFGTRLNAIGEYISPLIPIQAIETMSEHFFENAATFANSISGAQRIARRAGVDDIFELRTGDVARCDELVIGVLEESRMIAMAEGGLTGASGILGSVIDFPLALLLSLRTVYQVAHCYGFDLQGEEGRALAFEALTHSDLEILADKQGVLLTLVGMRTILESGDLRGVERLIGGGSEVAAVGGAISEFAQKLNLRRPALWLSRTVPVMTGAAGATYNIRLVTSVALSAQKVFRLARLNGEKAALVEIMATSLAEDRAENRDED